MRNNPDDISNQFINFIKKELKKLEKETDYSTYDDYDPENIHSEDTIRLDALFDRGRNVLACKILSKIKQYEKMEDFTK
tara:strand:+ start:179 stop:415 length:237 start_codon:yes stop_codon:yes gene_type:complete